MRFKRFFSGILAALLLIGCALPALAVDSPPQISAKSAIVYNVDTGTAVYEKDADVVVFPAALVKMMTALLAVEKCPDLFAEIAASESAVADIGNSANAAIKAGEIMTIKEYLYCLILKSANDAAYVLAETVGGDVPAFVNMMNQRAQELGMTSTKFTNPTGLHDDNMVTTARDMLLLTKHISKNAELMDIVNTSQKRIPPTNMTATDRTCITGNYLISKAVYTDYFYNYASGVISGSTSQGGYCLSTVSSKGGLTYLCVVLGASKDEETKLIQSFLDAKNLLEYFHENYQLLEVVSESAPIAEASVALAQGRDYVVLIPTHACSYLMPSNATKDVVEQTIKLDENITAPIEKGQVLGTLSFTHDGKEYGTVSLIAQTDISRSGFLYALHKIKTFFSSPWVKIVLSLLVFLFLLYVYMMFHINRKKKKKVLGKRNHYVGKR